MPELEKKLYDLAKRVLDLRNLSKDQKPKPFAGDYGVADLNATYEQLVKKIKTLPPEQVAERIIELAADYEKLIQEAAREAREDAREDYEEKLAGEHQKTEGLRSKLINLGKSLREILDMASEVK